jgi:hypothetical protein
MNENLKLILEVLSGDANQKEAEMVQQSKKLLSRTREIIADRDAKTLARTAVTNKRRSSRNP